MPTAPKPLPASELLGKAGGSSGNTNAPRKAAPAICRADAGLTCAALDFSETAGNLECKR